MRLAVRMHTLVATARRQRQGPAHARRRSLGLGRAITRPTRWLRRPVLAPQHAQAARQRGARVCSQLRRRAICANGEHTVFLWPERPKVRIGRSVRSLGPVPRGRGALRACRCVPEEPGGKRIGDEGPCGGGQLPQVDERGGPRSSSNVCLGGTRL